MEHVSIIIPTYNRADVIANSIQSILDQTYKQYELLIVDDGSTDDTASVIESLYNERIRYIKLPENKGVAAARNEGIRQAKYDYIAFQDSDDYWHKDKLEKQMDFLTKHPEIALLYCPYECQKNDGSVIIVPNNDIPLSEKQGNIYEYMLRRNTIGTPSVLLRKEALDKSGYFNETLTCLEDWELFLRISKHCEIAFLDEVLLNVNLSTDGVSHNISGYYEARCYMIATHKNALLNYGIFSDIVKEILESAEQLGILTQISKMLQYYLQQ